MDHTHTHECVCPLNETIKISQKTEHIKKRLRGESATSGHCAALGNAQKKMAFKKIHTYIHSTGRVGVPQPVWLCLSVCGRELCGQDPADFA